MDMQNKLCLVTGANSGIGKKTAQALAEMGAQVIMLCRNRERGEKARMELRKKTRNDDIKLLIADLSKKDEIRKAVEQFLKNHDRMDVLINNAGTLFNRRQENEDGIEMTFSVNHLGPFLLTNLLLPALTNANKARIVNVASEVHRLGARFFDLNDLQLQNGFSGMKAYGISKLCNIMFTHELSRRFSTDKITANSLHPGVIGSNLASEAGWLIKLVYILGKPFMKSPKTGAQTPIYLATSDEVEEISGKYFINCKERSPAAIAYEDEKTERLWEISSKLSNIS